jgi:hypothetical protein
MIGFTDILKNFGDFASGARTIEPHVQAITYPGQSGAQYHAADMREGLYRPYTNIPNDVVPDRRFMAEPGMVPVKNFSAQDPRRRLYERDLYEASKLLTKAFNGDAFARLMVKEAMYGRFREALAISDFPNLFGDVIDRAVIANYRETPYTWNMIAAHSDVADFRQVKRFRVDYGTAPNTTPIGLGAPYPEDKISDSAQQAGTYVPPGAAQGVGYYAYNLQKYGKRMPFYWETFINDDLNAIKDVPARFGRGMRRGEEYFVTSLFASNTNFFNTANFKNIVSAANSPGNVYTANNPPLSITALAQAMVVMSLQRDLDGQPIDIEAVTLVVPPALKVAAQNILNADYFFANDQGGTTIQDGSGATATLTSGQRLNVANWARNIVKLAVNYYLPIVDTTYGNQAWYLFSDPNSGRPAVEFAHLRGRRNPELFMKLPNSVAIGEGGMGPGTGPSIGTTMQNPMEGDFDTDAIHYKIRHVYGGVTMDPLMAVYSNGSGT